MNKRQSNLIMAKVAGYHNDSKLFTRLVIESRIKRDALNEAWITGASAKLAGVKCLCPDCKLPGAA